MELHAGIRRGDLEIERRGLDSLLLGVIELDQAVRKCVGNAEFHYSVSPGLSGMNPRRP